MTTSPATPLDARATGDLPIPPLVRRLRRAVGGTLAAVNRSVARTPPGRWLHARLHGALEITSTDVSVPGSDRRLDGLTIAFLSDLHAGHFMGAADLERLGERVAALGPDLVCLGGDLINTRLEEIHLLDGLLAALSPPLGVHAVPGNHEYYRRGLVPRWRSHLESRGVEVLLNRGLRLMHRGAELWLAGVDDLSDGLPDLAAALRGRRHDEPAVLLSHHPDLFPAAARQRVDLQLSGHTHGGQIKLFGWAPLEESRFLEGLFEHAGARLYVGRGLGVTALPLRVGARPELAVLRLRAG